MIMWNFCSSWNSSRLSTEGGVQSRQRIFASRTSRPQREKVCRLLQDGGVSTTAVARGSHTILGAGLSATAMRTQLDDRTQARVHTERPPERPLGLRRRGRKVVCLERESTKDDAEWLETQQLCGETDSPNRCQVCSQGWGATREQF